MGGGHRPLSRGSVRREASTRCVFTMRTKEREDPREGAGAVSGEVFGVWADLAAEKFEAAGYSVDHETVRLWLIAAGLWTRQRKRGPAPL